MDGPDSNSAARNSDHRQAVMERFADFLKAHSLKFTRERRRILDLCLSLPGHIVADDLIAQTNAGRNRVSKATVYRTLALLVQAGILRENRFTQNKVYYQLCTPGTSYAHVVCLNCGEITEFESEALEPVVREAAAVLEFVPQEYQLQIFGVCKKCRQGNESHFDPRRHPVWRLRHLR